MKLSAFFASLLPSFERNRITEDVDMLRKDLQDTLLPAYAAAAAMTKGKDFKAKALQDFNGLFIMMLPQYRRVGFVEGTLQFFNELPAKLDVLDALILELFAKDVTKDTITYRKAAILQYLETVRFASKFATRSLLRFLHVETSSQKGQSNHAEEMTPVELKWLKDNQSAYLQALKLLSHPAKELAGLLGEIPDIAVVPERMEMVKQTVGGDKLDPFRFGLISADINPIYHARLAYAEWQVKNYQAAIEEKRALELRLLAMSQAYEGKQDAKLSQQIEYSQGRLQKLNYAIAQMQEHYA